MGLNCLFSHLYTTAVITLLMESNSLDAKLVRSTFNSSCIKNCIIMNRFIRWFQCIMDLKTTVEFQWLEHLWDHRKLFETWVVRVTEG